MEQMIKYAGGNPGALSAMFELFGPNVNLKTSIESLQKLDEMTSIRGTNLYVLFSDLCDKNVDKMHKLLTTCPAETLEDACSRQDYSGRELVKEYLN